jgi:hypothetical protein
MTSLLDIVDQSETVEIKGHTLRVFPITAEGVGLLLLQFDSVRSMFGGTAITIKPEDLMLQAPDAVAGICALATTDRTEFAKKSAWLEHIEKANTRAAALPVSDQLKILTRCMRITFAEGTGPFVEMVKEFTAALSTTSEQGPPNGALGTTSQGQFNAALQTGIHPETPGTTPPDSSKGTLN